MGTSAMLDGGDVYAKRTLDFVARLQQLTRYDDICRHIVQEMEWFGFSCVSDWSVPRAGVRLRDSIWLNNRPAQYVERYAEQNYVLRDPLVRELRYSLHPFSWDDLRARRKLSKVENAILDEGREFGARNGFIVPIVTLSGSSSIFAPCGLDPDLSQRARSAIEIMGIYSHHALQRALMEQKRHEATRAPLTRREREIMQWVAAGKTDDEIGRILAISTATVHEHIESSKRKLDAFRRTYAVVQAIRFGEISI